MSDDVESSTEQQLQQLEQLKQLEQLEQLSSTTPPQADPALTIRPAHPRTDFFTRDVVNQAIAAIPTLGVQQAAEYLASMNVPPEVAIRTLRFRG